MNDPLDQLRDIVGVFGTPWLKYATTAMFIIALVVVLSLLVLLMKKYFRRSDKAVMLNYKKRAQINLKRLVNHSEKGGAEFYDLYSLTMRDYLENHFGLKVLDKSAAEIAAMVPAQLPDDFKNRWPEIIQRLHFADGVRYAAKKDGQRAMDDIGFLDKLVAGK